MRRRPWSKAPDFDLPAADRDGRIVLGDYLRRGPVLLSLLLGLYCPFCRRRISQLKPTCDALREARIELVGVVIASVERARRYFELAVRRPCFLIAAAPDRSLHRAYRLMSFDRSPQFVAEKQLLASEALREMGIETVAENAGWAFTLAGGYEWTPKTTPNGRSRFRRPVRF